MGPFPGSLIGVAHSRPLVISPLPFTAAHKRKRRVVEGNGGESGSRPAAMMEEITEEVEDEYEDEDMIIDSEIVKHNTPVVTGKALEFLHFGTTSKAPDLDPKNYSVGELLKILHIHAPISNQEELLEHGRLLIKKYLSEQQQEYAEFFALALKRLLEDYSTVETFFRIQTKRTNGRSAMSLIQATEPTYLVNVSSKNETADIEKSVEPEDSGVGSVFHFVSRGIDSPNEDNEAERHEVGAKADEGMGEGVEVGVEAEERVVSKIVSAPLPKISPRKITRKISRPVVRLSFASNHECNLISTLRERLGNMLTSGPHSKWIEVVSHWFFLVFLRIRFV